MKFKFYNHVETIVSKISQKSFTGESKTFTIEQLIRPLILYAYPILSLWSQNFSYTLTHEYNARSGLAHYINNDQDKKNRSITHSNSKPMSYWSAEFIQQSNKKMYLHKQYKPPQ